MPDIGKTINGRKIGMKRSGRYIYHACEICGVKRWEFKKSKERDRI